MAKNTNLILKEVLKKIKPSEEEMKNIKNIIGASLKKVELNIKRRKINAQVFVGGSFAKGTLIKKDGYDIDIFIRFDKKYKDELLSDLTEKILENTKKERIHGSRDYFKAKISEILSLEFVPVKKISNPRGAENVTDLSYSHVNYIKKRLKNQKLLDEVRLAKAFCYANGSYGAESYVQGFSGYGLELLIYHHGSFLKFIRAMAKTNVKNKTIIDIERYYKNRDRILLDINSAKLQSPIILVDPTYKQRNVLAALSIETFNKFQRTCKNFLKRPTVNFFEPEILNLSKIKSDAQERGYEFILLKAETDRQPGDIAGSKLLKFYRHLCAETAKFFDIKAKDFEYDKGKTARFFFAVKKKESILILGPNIGDKENVSKFKAKHKSVFIKNGRLYSKEKTRFSIKNFITDWKFKNKNRMKEMHVINLEILI